MTRRSILGALLALPARGAAAVLLDARTGKLLDIRQPQQAAQVPALPGSTLKPLLFAALIDNGKLRAGEQVACPGPLSIHGRSFACVHPRMAVPLDVAAALAYSCNQFTARVVERLRPAEQAELLRRYGLASRTQLDAEEVPGRVRTPPEGTAVLQALGESDVEVTVLGLASAYRRLALSAPAAVREGMEGAVRFGTAQLARVPGVQVAGKTGSAGNGRWAWFAGFAPSVQPRYVVAVRTQGASGGADAAPVAAEMLAAAFRRHA